MNDLSQNLSFIAYLISYFCHIYDKLFIEYVSCCVNFYEPGVFHVSWYTDFGHIMIWAPKTKSLKQKKQWDFACNFVFD